ncbi:MAG: 50S ribosomal protein L29 [Cyanobacteria bacterium P01_A01_bin.135]
MPLSKASEIRELTDQEIADEVLAVKKQLFDLRFQKGTRRLEKPHQFKHLRHRLAQLMTVEQERAASAPGADSADTETSDSSITE